MSHPSVAIQPPPPDADCETPRDVLYRLSGLSPRKQLDRLWEKIDALQEVVAEIQGKVDSPKEWYFNTPQQVREDEVALARLLIQTRHLLSSFIERQDLIAQHAVEGEICGVTGQTIAIQVETADGSDLLQIAKEKFLPDACLTEGDRVRIENFCFLVARSIEAAVPSPSTEAGISVSAMIDKARQDEESQEPAQL